MAVKLEGAPKNNFKSKKIIIITGISAGIRNKNKEYRPSPNANPSTCAFGFVNNLQNMQIFRIQYDPSTGQVPQTQSSCDLHGFKYSDRSNNSC